MRGTGGICDTVLERFNPLPHIPTLLHNAHWHRAGTQRSPRSR
jgi:hypothetical protein